MQVIKYPALETWSTLLSRPALDSQSLFEKVGSILSDVKHHGDKAVKKYTFQFDKVQIDQLEVTREEIEDASLQIPKDLKLILEE